MKKKTELHTEIGDYKPEKYWSFRARLGAESGNLFNAVCALNATSLETKSQNRLQHYVMKSAFKKLNLKGKKILEFGCGVGRWVNFFKKYHCTWSGVDISEPMLEIARRLHPDKEFKKIQNEKIPFPDNSFDLVYSVTVIHHNPYENHEKIISEMLRVLKDDGYLILFENINWKHKSFNMFPRSFDGWKSLLERHGMRCIWYKGARDWIVKDSIAYFKRRIAKLLKRNQEIKSTDEVTLKPPKSGLMRNIIACIGLIMDPYLLRFLPSKYHSIALMVFTKDLDHK